MPPVRWKLSVTITCFSLLVIHTNSQIIRQGDGWKPILGTGKPNFYESFPPDEKSVYKFEAFSTLPPTLQPSRKPIFAGSPKPLFTIGRKIPHQKHIQPDPYFALPTHENHGPHVPIGAVVHTRPSQIGHIKQHTSNKPHIQFIPSNKRIIKPLRIQNDIFASAASGPIIYKQRPSNIRTRETIDLGIPGTNHYSINQPHAHIEFTNRFSLPSAEFSQFSNGVPAFIFGKHPQSNDVSYQFGQNDEFTRNLLPPPQTYKETSKPKPESVVLQVPPPAFQYNNQKSQAPVQVQVTKEKIQQVPSPYHSQYIEYDFSDPRKPTEPPKPVYEVTEAKVYEIPTQTRTRTRRPNQPKRRPNFEEQPTVFLPTPYKPEKQGVEPTSPTQSEVSTIFTKLSKVQREKEATTVDPNAYSVIEVSTHYPILGKPVFQQELPNSQELSNEITTHPTEMEPTTPKETQRRPLRKRRPENRRTTTTTTETPNEIEDVEKPRIRVRPTVQRYRTTTLPAASSEESSSTVRTRGRNRYRQRITQNLNYEPTRIRRPTHPKSEEDSSKPLESEEAASEKSEEFEESPRAETITEQPKRVRYETVRPVIISTTERAPTTNFAIPENEIEETQEITTTTTPPTTTATTTTTTTRIRRPLRFDNSNRPRFSVKDFRQKLGQQQQSTTEASRTTESLRIRMPSRIRRPSFVMQEKEEESTEPVRSKFTPKDPRHGSTTEASGIITEKNVKSVNTRLRPFGRFKQSSSTTTTSTPKISIKPNLFARKRPPMLSLRHRIQSRIKNETESTTEDNEVKETFDQIVERQQESEEESIEDVEIETVSSTTENWKTGESAEVETTTADDISKIDPYFYSQRVSDLTSSAKNDYNTPGAFKSVAPVSRRIPNYFTISTEDPVLPIEAFFTSLKDKPQDKNS